MSKTGGLIRRMEAAVEARDQARRLAATEHTVTVGMLLFLYASAQRLLFLGEYTHLFSVAAAKFVNGIAEPGSKPVQLQWWSTEFSWPKHRPMVDELESSLRFLKEHGVHVQDGVDATRISLQLQGLHGAIWMMAFPFHEKKYQKSKRVCKDVRRSRCFPEKRGDMP